MKFCTSHAAKLRQVVIDRGLGAYLSKDLFDGNNRLNLMARGKAYTRENFEPFLLAQHILLTNAASNLGSMRVRVLDAGDPERACPLCAMREQFASFQDVHEAEWMERAVSEVAGVAEQAGLQTRLITLQ